MTVEAPDFQPQGLLEMWREGKLVRPIIPKTMPAENVSAASAVLSDVDPSKLVIFHDEDYPEKGAI
jgi:hypothetical protein